MNQPIPVTNCTPGANSVLAGNEAGLQSKLLNAPCNPNLLLQAPGTFGSDSVWNYEISLSSTLDGNYIGTRTDAPYGETITLTNINTYLVHLPAYGLVNFRFGAFGDNWTATAFCNNLFNKEALLDPQPQINLQMAAFARYIVNQPRTVGVDLTYKFR